MCNFLKNQTINVIRIVLTLVLLTLMVGWLFSLLFAFIADMVKYHG